jgi:hypothetical protein
MLGFHSLLRKVAAAGVSLAGLLACVSADAQDPYFNRGCPGCRDYQYGQPDLFRNYYVPPACGGVGATMYMSPGPVPAHVGHTYVTYEPFMPHEYLYKHHKTYHRSYDEGRGLTRTHVSYYTPPGKVAISHLHHGLKLAR